jgi:hypothetical protein
MQLIFTKYSVRFLKATALAIAFLFISKQDFAQICANPGSIIYSLSNSGLISPITVSTGAVGTTVNTAYSSSTSSANGIGYNTINGLFYYFQNAGSSSQQFVSYNPSTSTYATLPASPITAGVNRGCVNFNGTGYYCLDQNGNLCYYDIVNNVWTLICSVFTDQYGNNVTSIFKSQGSGDMAIDALGNLWIVTSNASQWGLYKLSTPLATTSVASMTVQQLIAPTTATPTNMNFVGIAFDPSGFIYMATNNDLYLLKNDLTLTHLAAFSTAGICGDLTSCNYPFAILPVTFQNLNVVDQNNNAVSVSWQVSQQLNNKGYYVQQSANGIDWNDKGFVANDNANEISETYSFIDNSPANGQNFYRICEVDIDGGKSYSEIKSVNIGLTVNSTVSIWPNPAKDVIKIQNNNTVSSIACVYNQSGALMSEHVLQSGTNTINVSNLIFGAYIVNIKSADGSSYNQKFIKD